MPVLPVSDFWQRSFVKYYKLRWVQQQDWKKEQRRKSNYNQPILPLILVKCNIFIVIISALILNMIVLSIPISNNTSFNAQTREVNPYLYVTYQSIYTVK